MTKKKKKATSGGRFDRSQHFAYFTATSAERHLSKDAAHLDIFPYKHVLVAVNELDTPKSLDAFRRLLDQGRSILLDSGIFNLAMTHARAHDVHMDVALSLAPSEIDGFEQLKDLYYRIVTEFKDQVWGVIEMDQGGVANKPTTRAMIEKETGVIPIPVFHPLLDGLEYYERLATEYDRMCVGNLVQAQPNVRVRLLHAVYELSRKHPDVWHHLLGVTSNPNSFSLPIYGSCDSSSWLAPARWPQGWKARAAGQTVGSYGSEWWYTSDKYANAGSEDQAAPEVSNYYRGDAVSLLNVFTLERAINDEWEARQELWA